MKPKPIVHYVPHPKNIILLGYGALVKLINSKLYAKTSPVLKYDGAGCFETTNTLYIPRPAKN
jgi:hypothetical protein